MSKASFYLRLSDVICEFVEQEYLLDGITTKERRKAYRKVRLLFDELSTDLLSHKALKEKISTRLGTKLYQETAKLPDLVPIQLERRVVEEPETSLQAVQCFQFSHKLAERS